MQRRAFLAAASVGSIIVGPLVGLAGAQSGTADIDVAGNRIFYRRYGHGPAILMVHGFPRTSLMWRYLGPKLPENHSLICVDLRAYGRSGAPASTDDHSPYSKRTMAGDLVDVMAKPGFPTFTLIGHDKLP